MQKRFRILLVLLIAAALALAAGCAKPAPDTKAPVSGTIGSINMLKAIQAHPKYTELDRLNKQMNTLAAEIEQQLSVRQSGGITAGLPGDAAQGLSGALEQEMSAQIGQKQAELQQRLNEKAGRIRSELAADMQAYAEGVNKEYQPRIFNLQLKLKTVQLSKEEAEKIQQDMENLQAERNAKLAAKEQELAGSIEARMLPEQQAAEQELAAYAQQLTIQKQQIYSEKTAEIAARSPQPPAGSNAVTGLEQQAGMKKQEIMALEEYIIKDVRDKAAKIAAERKLDTVLANVRVNIQAVDITDMVIAEFKK